MDQSCVSRTNDPKDFLGRSGHCSLFSTPYATASHRIIRPQADILDRATARPSIDAQTPLGAGLHVFSGTRWSDSYNLDGNKLAVSTL